MIVLLAASLAAAAPESQTTDSQPTVLAPAQVSTGADAPPSAVPAGSVPVTPVPVSAPNSTPAADATVAPAQAASPTSATTPVIVLPPLPPAPDAAATAPADAGAIVVSGRTGPPPGDPVVALNKAAFVAVQAVDQALMEPAAKGYAKAVPSPIRAGLRHFFANLTEPVIALNFLLQLHPGKAAETLGRFAINSTIGIGGLLDVAKTKTFKLPYRRNGFAYTLGYYGIGPGPYLFLPLVGPTTLRDVIGLGIDRAALPLSVGGPLRSPAYVIGSFVVRSLNDRLADDERIKAMRKAGDPYTATKEAYLASRKAEIEALHFRHVPGAPHVAPPPAPQSGLGIPVPPPEDADDAPAEATAPQAPAPAAVPTAPAPSQPAAPAPATSDSQVPTPPAG